MTASIEASIETVSWEQLAHAYGPAADLAPLMRRVATTKGDEFQAAMGELWPRILHLGTIYTASAAVAHIAIEILKTADDPERDALYELLGEFAQAARTSIRNGRVIPSCSGGNPRDGEAISKTILENLEVFEPDILNPEASIRAGAVRLLTAFFDTPRGYVKIVQDHHLKEASPLVRKEIVLGLLRMNDVHADFARFIDAALARETDTGNRFLLRYAEIRRDRARSSSKCVDDLVESFIASSDTPYFLVLDQGDAERFADAAFLLGEPRGSAAMCTALNKAWGEQFSVVIAHHLLRRIFGDQRTGWSQASSPNRLDFSALEGSAPVIPEKLSAEQAAALAMIANHPPLWRIKTNLWELFGLPATKKEFQQFAAARA